MVEFPAGAKIHFNLTADAPMNSFWIPSLGGQLMAMPGMSAQLNLEASTQGVYKGYSAVLSGKGFAGMTFDARAVSQADYVSWVASVKSSNNPLNVDTYEALAKPSEYNATALYAPADPNLYNYILQKYMAPSRTDMPMKMDTQMHMP
jgi:cytochrome o ubiquinol oxidase subunit 2